MRLYEQQTQPAQDYNFGCPTRIHFEVDYFQPINNDLFYFVSLSSLYNFADNNTLSAFTTTVSTLIKILGSESEIAIDWFKENKMVVNPHKFQAIILDKRKREHTDERITVQNQQIKVVLSVKLLGL